MKSDSVSVRNTQAALESELASARQNFLPYLETGRAMSKVLTLRSCMQHIGEILKRQFSVALHSKHTRALTFNNCCLHSALYDTEPTSVEVDQLFAREQEKSLFPCHKHAGPALHHGAFKKFLKHSRRSAAPQRSGADTATTERVISCKHEFQRFGQSRSPPRRHLGPMARVLCWMLSLTPARPAR